MLTGSDAVEHVAREGGAALFDDPDWRGMAEGFPLMRAQVLADAGRFEEAAAEFKEAYSARPLAPLRST